MSDTSILPIALDAMGGDHGLAPIIEGALKAHALGIRVVLVGDGHRVYAELLRQGQHRGIDIVHASGVMTMDDHASDIRKHSQSSIQVAMRLVKSGQASAVVSMGHSGATMASALLTLGRLKGIDRPAIVGRLPNAKGVGLLLDMGANADVKPRHYAQWALLATHHLRDVYGVEHPSVGLLSIGEEAHKGSQGVIEAHQLLKNTSGISFYGNVEGSDLFKGTTDIVVTDGFTGNVVLKTIEGEAKMLMSWLRESLESSLWTRLGGLLAKQAFRQVRAKLDPSEYGASPLLGVQGLVFIGHGSSDARAVEKGLLYAQSVVQSGTLSKLKESLAKM